MQAVSFEDIQQELIYRLCEQPLGLREYCKAAWTLIEPATVMSWAWFHDAICDHLEAVSNGQISNLVINIPPRHAKSTFVAIMWPTWAWGPRGLPHTRWIFSSYAQSLSQRDSQRRRYLMASSWYRAGWDHVFKLGRQKWMADGQIKYQNSEHGYHLSTSVQGSNTGEGGDVLVADDPHNMKEIHSETVRQSVIQWWTEVMTTRINDQRKVAKVIIMQRGHEADLAGFVLAKHTYTHLNLQAEFDPRRRCFTALDNGQPFFEDPRTAPGELLFPERFPTAVIERLKMELGDAYAAQFQQDPTPEEGGIIKRRWWRYWVPSDHPLVGMPDVNGQPILPLPYRFEYLIDSWDATFKDEEQHDYVTGLKWGKEVGAARSYLLAGVHDHLAFTDTCDAVEGLALSWRQPPDAIYIEDAANGPAIINTLRHRVPGVLPSSVESSKTARMHASSPRVKAGNYVLPHPSLPGYEWVAGQAAQWESGHLEPGTFLHELSMFPNAAHDDYCDAFTQADRHLFLGHHFDESNFEDQDTGALGDVGI